MSETGPAAPDRTGLTSVDDVVASVDALDGRPLDEHAEVYEQAHQRLRRALDETDQPASPEPPVDPAR